MKYQVVNAVIVDGKVCAKGDVIELDENSKDAKYLVSFGDVKPVADKATAKKAADK